MIWDHNRGLMYQRAEAAYSDPRAARYIWGTAFHWYVGDHYDNARLLHDAFPDKGLLFTEGAVRGTWEAAFRLTKNVILDLNNWTAGWTAWNLLLDPDAAPAMPAADGGTIVNADPKTGELTFNRRTTPSATSRASSSVAPGGSSARPAATTSSPRRSSTPTGGSLSC